MKESKTLTDEELESKSKLAKPGSPQFRAKYAQDRRKKRKQRNEEE